MKVVALVSGGKDSCYAMMKCIQYGHQIVALANLMPADESVDELDSYMYQTVGHQIIVSYAECMGLPLFRRRIQGSPRHEKLNYRTTSGDEVEDLFVLLNEVKRQIPSVTAVSSGAIASDYQRLRVESVCSRLGLVSLAYLWKQDQSLLLQEMITNGIVAITVKVASMGLDPAKHLGKEIASLESHLHKLNELYGVNVCGEGGEYETLTLDCPLFVIVLHSSDSIAPVGVVHPLKFHLEKKGRSNVLSDQNGTNDIHGEKIGSMFEVQGDCLQSGEPTSQDIAKITDLVKVTHDRLHTCKTKKDSTFSICCWLEDSHQSSAGLEQDLKLVLKHIESQLSEHGHSWQHVLYIHLYIADMNEFTIANETYVRFITQEKCLSGVPSRSTLELPLMQAGLGRAYIEVLVTNDPSKNVLHVQSISSWAPSCIGPYSQATLHKEILYMAGQLGLYPPTMTLPGLSPAAELEQALRNSEAVANCFNCSISTNAILFTIYCSQRTPLSDRPKIQDKQEAFLDQLRLLQLENGCKCKTIVPMFLYILVPDLPKRAFVEVKPILFTRNDTETAGGTSNQKLSSNMAPDCWAFQHVDWHDSCIQKCAVNSRVCAVLLSITNEHAKKLCSESLGTQESSLDYQDILTKGNVEKLSRFCVYLLDKVILAADFSWEDTMNLRIYLPTNLDLNQEVLFVTFTSAFNELAGLDRRLQVGKEPIFNFVPVLAAGRSASMENIITCEFFATKS